MSYKAYGTEGEKEVISLIKCPNCGRELMSLPESYPLCDALCSACHFRAQIKTSSSSPYKSKTVRGSGWDIMEKSLKAGALIPSLIVNYKWEEKGQKKQEIRFYPFVLKRNLSESLRSIKQKNGKVRKYWMFDYIDLDSLPFLKLY
jgi:hypothetical protein